MLATILIVFLVGVSILTILFTVAVVGFFAPLAFIVWLIEWIDDIVHRKEDEG